MKETHKCAQMEVSSDHKKTHGTACARPIDSPSLGDKNKPAVWCLNWGEAHLIPTWLSAWHRYNQSITEGIWCSMGTWSCEEE